jgi:hypothetical protein
MGPHVRHKLPTSHHQAPAPSRTWRNLPLSTLFEISNLLTKSGGVRDERLAGDREIWRVRIGGSVFTGYGTGTVFCTGGYEPEIGFVYQRIDSLVKKVL